MVLASGVVLLFLSVPLSTRVHGDDGFGGMHGDYPRRSGSRPLESVILSQRRV